MKEYIIGISLVLFTILSFEVHADFVSYSDSLCFEVETKHFIYIHCHDWSNRTKEQRWKMISTNKDLFNSANDYSYLICMDKKTDSIIFRVPCPPLNEVYISEDEKTIVGLSKIKLWNPVQLVVFASDGRLLKKRHISSSEAKLTLTEYETFKNNFPVQNKFLDSVQSIYSYSNYIYIDFYQMQFPDYLDEAWEYLLRHISKNHITANCRESVSNWVFWYNEENLDLKIENKMGLPFSISLKTMLENELKYELTKSNEY